MKEGKLHTRLMGSDFELIATGPDDAFIARALETGVAEIQRLERLLTEFSDSSDTARINAAAGGSPVKVAPEVYHLLERCVRISELSQGAFDITAGALKKLYRFRERPSALPSDQAVKEVSALTGYRFIRLLPGYHVSLARKGMHVGFGAIGKGYAADRVKQLWLQLGMKAGVVNASGDLTAWGLRPDGSQWKIGIANPRVPGKVLLWLPVDHASVATSGDYEQYIELEGKRYSHNIDPRTGKPARLLKSVTVLSPSAELSDALATAVTIMGREAGLNMINQLPGLHCVVIDDHDRVFTSDKINIHAQTTIQPQA